MANALSPTAANIISSLGIKGAVGRIPPGQGGSFGGFVPMLNSNGQLDPSFISPDSVSSSIPAFRNVAIVDQGTSIEEGRNGSVSAPFKTINEAAGNFATDTSKNLVLVLMSGKYFDTEVSFGSEPKNVYIVCVGDVVLNNAMTISGVLETLYIQGLNISQGIAVVGCEYVEFLSGTKIGGQVDVGDAVARISSEASGDYSSIRAGRKEWISGAYCIGYSLDVPTVGDALDAISIRSIRVPEISAGQSGLVVGQGTDIHSENGRYDLTSTMSTLASAINSLFNSGKFSNIEVSGSLEAGTIHATSIRADELNMKSLLIGGYRIAVDSYGYLVVLDGGDDPPEPPEGVILLRDTETYEMYILGISSGRLYLVKADESEAIEPKDYIEVIDGGQTYRVYVENGHLVRDRSDEP